MDDLQKAPSPPSGKSSTCTEVPTARQSLPGLLFHTESLANLKAYRRFTFQYPLQFRFVLFFDIEIFQPYITMLLATASEGSGPVRAVLLCAIVGGVLYGVYQILSIGKRGRKLPPGRLSLSSIHSLRDLVYSQK